MIQLPLIIKKAIGLLVAVILLFPAWAQDAKTEDQPKEQLQAFSVAAIREAGNNTDKILKDARTLATDTARLYALDSTLTKIKGSNNFRIDEDSVYVDYSAMTLWALKNESKYWRDYRAELNAYQTKANDLLDQLTASLNMVSQLNTRWSLTERMVDTLDLSDNIVASVKDYKQKTESARSTINWYIDEALSIGAKANVEIRQSDRIISQIESLRSDKAKDIFSQDAKPLFSALGENKRGFLSALKVGVKTSLNAFFEFLKTSSNNVIYHLTFIILLIVFMFWLGRRFNKSSYAQDDVYDDVSRIFKMPLLSGLSLGLIMAGLFYENPPRIFIDMLIVIGILPIIFLLPRILNQKLRFFWYFVFVLIFLEKISGMLVNDETDQRLLLFVAGLIAVPGFTYALLPKSDFYQAIKAKSKSIGLLTIRLMLLIMIVALVFNIRGSYQLSILLTGGVIHTMVVGMLVFIGVRITQAVLFVFIRSGFFGKVNFLIKYAREAQWWVFNSIGIYGLYIWLRAVLSSFALLNPFIDAYKRFLETSWQFGEVTLSVNNIVDFCLILFVFWLIANVFNLVIKEELLPRFDMRKGFPLAITVLSRYVILFLGFVLAMAAAGISLSKLNLIIGALGVGIGFGLQNIVSNFVSGLVILFERPVRIGDVVSTGSLGGEVIEIGLRSSRIRTWEGAEVILPNNNLVANEVTNWTYSDKRRRVERMVLIESGPNPRDVKRVMDEVIKQQDGLIEDEQAQAYFLGYEDNAMKFRVLLWMYDNLLRNPSELLMNLHEALTSNGFKPYMPIQKVVIGDKASEIAASKIIGQQASSSDSEEK